ncbi:MAG: SCP-like extracellular [Myxococcaceae bacterium]|nr:SCP-like extracellular [Myxococcaceae bacterium]
MAHPINTLILLAATATATGCALETATPGDCLHCSTAQQETSITSAEPAATVSAGEAATCAAWAPMRDLQTRTAGWSSGSTACGAGALPDATRQASLTWVNYYRALAGLAPLSETAADRAAAQSCAVMLERNGQLSHTPPTTWACADATARATAGRSNLSGNPGFPMSPWYAVRGWVDEGRDLSNTLGHRRWMLSPELRSMAYGQTGSFACMTLGIGARDPAAPAFVAWPPAGWVPTAVVGTIWSLSRPGVAVAGTTVQVTRDGAALAVNAAARPAGFGDDTVSWEMPAVVAGSSYRVRVSAPGAAAIEYEVRPTGCGAR